MEEFEKVSGQIFQLVKQMPLSIEQLLKALKGTKKEKIWSIVSFLQAERKVKTNEDGLISMG